MKPIFWLLLFITIPLNVFSQQNNEMLLDSSMSYRWDSETGDWVEDKREYWVYDINGNLTEHIYYEWNLNSNDRVGNWRYVDTYDANGNLTEHIGYWLNSASNDWVGRKRYTDTYDASGNLTEHIDYLWHSAKNDWVENWRYVDTYDANGNLTEHIEDDWRIVSDYDANGNLIKKIWYEWCSETGSWKYLPYYCPGHGYSFCGGGHFVFTYDMNGYLTEEIKYEWDSVTNAWVGIPLSAWAYDSSGNQTEKIEYVWDSETNAWLGIQRSVWVYDSSGNQTEKIEYVWDSETNAWLGIQRSVWVYDSSGNLIEEIVNVYRTVYTYDANGNLIEEIEYYGNSPRDKNVYYWSYPLLLQQIIYVDENCCDTAILGSMITGNMYPRENITFYITGGNSNNLFAVDSLSGDIRIQNCSDLDFDTSSIYNLTVEAIFEDNTRRISDTAVISIFVNYDITSVREPIFNTKFNSLIKLYPNPVNDLLTIETEKPGQYTIEITSLNGQLLYNDRMEGPTHQIDLSSFEKGLYFITVRSMDYVRTEKIIKQ
jgi:YD repeat-containing protein